MADQSITPPDAQSVAHLFAAHLVKGKPTDVAAADLAEALSEIELRTQISGASFITVTLTDPDWTIQTDGLLDVDDDGLLPDIEVNFPDGSDNWWRLEMVEGANDLGQPNLTLTLEDRIVGWLRDLFGQKTIKPGTRTRAQFVHQLVQEAQRRKGAIRFVCPSLGVVQPLEKAHPNRNKSRGVHKQAAVTAKGVALTQHQVDEANALLGVAEKERASELVAVSLICAAIGESDLGGNPTTYKPNSAGYWGVLQGASGQPPSAPNFPDPHDTAGMALAFLKGDKGFGHLGAGALKLARTISDPGQIATLCEGSGQPANFYGQYADEAKKIVAAYGSLKAGSQSSTTRPVSDVGQLQRGTTDDPGEDSWTCITRLAGEVDWFAFSNADSLYYMDGPDLAAQKPALYIDRIADAERINRVSYAVDSTAVSRKKVKGRVLTRPQTPTQVTLSLLCEPLEFRGGDLFVLQNFGPPDGRWIVQDATRKCLAETFTQFTLVKPSAPAPEPRASASSKKKRSSDKPLGSVAAAALKALDEKAKYTYREVRPMPKSLFGPTPRIMDCSAFATLCYKAAGAPDPNGLHYNGQGYTGTLIANCEKVTDPLPGDLCFYGAQLRRSTTAVPSHVTVYVGNGEVVSMGQQGDPSKGPAAQMKSASDSFLGYYRPKS